MTVPKWEKEKQPIARETQSKEKNKHDRNSAGKEEGDTPSQLENRKMTHVESREGDEEDDEAVERRLEFDDWMDLGVEIWGTVCDGVRDNGVVWSEDMTEQEKLRDVTRLEAACRNPLSINIHGSMKKKMMHCLTNEHTMHKHITSVHSANDKKETNRPRGKLCNPANRKYSSTTVRRRASLQASLVVEEPQDGDACTKVRVTLCSPDPALLIGAQAAVDACLRVYYSLLAEPRLVALLEPAKALGENSGTPGGLAVLRLYRSHWEMKEEDIPTWKKSAPTMHHQGMEQAVLDRLGCKTSAIQKATKAALTVLTELLSPAGED
ncbi:unnamed protein product [Merluccius merluccius]